MTTIDEVIQQVLNEVCDVDDIDDLVKFVEVLHELVMIKSQYKTELPKGSK